MEKFYMLTKTLANLCRCRLEKREYYNAAALSTLYTLIPYTLYYPVRQYYNNNDYTI